MAFETITRLAFVLATIMFSSAPANEFSQVPNDVNQLLLSSTRTLCQNVVTFNARFSVIGSNFINNTFIASLITCLDLTNSFIENIENGAFEKFPNLTYLDLSHNTLLSGQLLSFGDNKKLKVLIMNYATKIEDQSVIEIFNYPNLEILSLRGNRIADFCLPDRIQHFKYNSDIPDTSHTEQQKIPFPKLKALDLSDNDIGDNNFVKLLPNTLESLDLTYNRFSSFVLNTKGTYLSLLNLNNNRLKSVVNTIKYDESLSNNDNPYDNYNENLTFDENIRCRLELAGLENLRYLSISRNEINFIESNAFQNTNKLIYINLSSNYIEYLHPETFAKLQFLTTLDLSYNEFRSVPEISGANISNLYLSCNKIESITSNTFVQTPNLTKLLLGANQISEIDSKAFAYLSILERLDLSKNKLNFLPERWIESLTSLKQLDLSDNKITSLESLSLAGTLSLAEVYLAMKQLEYLNSTYIETLPRNLSIKLVQRSSFANWKLLCPIE